MAGLLDLLQGQGGGSLLDFLRQNAGAAVANNPGGLPSDTPNYGSPAPMSFAPPPQAQIMPANQPNAIDSAPWPQGPVGAPSFSSSPQPQIVPANQPNSIDSAAWPQGPIGAPMNANAAMPQRPAPMSMAGPAPAPAAPASSAAPEGDNRFMLGLKGFLGNLSGGPIGALAGGLGAAVTGQPTDAGSIAAQKSNLTARALLAKGADPAAVAAAAKNPALMTELIKQHYGPQNVTSLGNGYVWDQKAGKAIKAYEPEAKAPTSLGEGYIYNPESGKVERAYTPDAKKGVTKEISDREQAIVSRGGDPKDARNAQYILTGKFPREDAQPLTATDKKFIDEADDGIFAARNVINALNTAKKLSPDANSGYFASKRATLGNNLPDALLPDFISSPKSSEATTNYENVVLGQALGQLKSIFGAAPTEGERKILLDLQASADKPDKIRQEILNRATELAQRKLEYNQQRADALRGGSFYRPGYNVDGSQQPKLQPGQSTGMGDVVIKRID